MWNAEWDRSMTNVEHGIWMSTHSASIRIYFWCETPFFFINKSSEKREPKSTCFDFKFFVYLLRIRYSKSTTVRHSNDNLALTNKKKKNLEVPKFHSPVHYLALVGTVPSVSADLAIFWNFAIQSSTASKTLLKKFFILLMFELFSPIGSTCCGNSLDCRFLRLNSAVFSDTYAIVWVYVVGRLLDFVACDATFEESEERFFRLCADMASSASPVPAFTSCECETPNNGVSIDEQIHSMNISETKIGFICYLHRTYCSCSSMPSSDTLLYHIDSDSYRIHGYIHGRCAFLSRNVCRGCGNHTFRCQPTPENHK